MTFELWTTGMRDRGLTWHALDMAILEHSVVSYGGGVYRRSRLLENAAKEMGYTALRDKPKK